MPRSGCHHKAYDLILWIIPSWGSFPGHKFLIADRIESLLLDILEHLVEAPIQEEGRISQGRKPGSGEVEVPDPSFERPEAA